MNASFGNNTSTDLNVALQTRRAPNRWSVSCRASAFEIHIARLPLLVPLPLPTNNDARQVHLAERNPAARAARKPIYIRATPPGPVPGPLRRTCLQLGHTRYIQCRLFRYRAPSPPFLLAEPGNREKFIPPTHTHTHNSRPPFALGIVFCIIPPAHFFFLLSLFPFFSLLPHPSLSTGRCFLPSCTQDTLSRERVVGRKGAAFGCPLTCQRLRSFGLLQSHLAAIAGRPQSCTGLSARGVCLPHSLPPAFLGSASLPPSLLAVETASQAVLNPRDPPKPLLPLPRDKNSPLGLPGSSGHALHEPSRLHDFLFTPRPTGPSAVSPCWQRAACPAENFSRPHLAGPPSIPDRPDLPPVPVTPGLDAFHIPSVRGGCVDLSGLCLTLARHTKVSKPFLLADS